MTISVCRWFSERCTVQWVLLGIPENQRTYSRCFSMVFENQLRNAEARLLSPRRGLSSWYAALSTTVSHRNLARIVITSHPPSKTHLTPNRPADRRSMGHSGKRNTSASEAGSVALIDRKARLGSVCVAHAVIRFLQYDMIVGKKILQTRYYIHLRLVFCFPLALSVIPVLSKGTVKNVRIKFTTGGLKPPCFHRGFITVCSR